MDTRTKLEAREAPLVGLRRVLGARKCGGPCMSVCGHSCELGAGHDDVAHVSFARWLGVSCAGRRRHSRAQSAGHVNMSRSSVGSGQARARGDTRLRPLSAGQGGARLMLAWDGTECSASVVSALGVWTASHVLDSETQSAACFFP